MTINVYDKLKTDKFILIIESLLIGFNGFLTALLFSNPIYLFSLFGISLMLAFMTEREIFKYWGTEKMKFDLHLSLGRYIFN